MVEVLVKWEVRGIKSNDGRICSGYSGRMKKNPYISLLFAESVAKKRDLDVWVFERKRERDSTSFFWD